MPAIVDGTFDVSALWEPTSKNKIIRASKATNRLRVGGTGSSKALQIDTPIATPDGWVRIRDLVVGDTVYDERGQPCKVTNTTPTMQNASVEFAFDSGETLIADLGHQWHTHTRADRIFSMNGSIKTSAQIRNSLGGAVANHGIALYQLPWELQKLKGGKREHEEWRFIHGALDVGVQDVCCISVDSPSHLYLAGRGLIPTHNSSDSLMEALQEYMVRYDGIAVLFLRRQLTDLKKSSILDWLSFVPKELYHWNATDNIATLYNGSKLFFGHLPNSCLAGDTLITTAEGLKRIDQIVEGDSVLTRQGYKRVTWAAKTGHRETVQFGPIRATPCHKVYESGKFRKVSDILASRSIAYLSVHVPSKGQLSSLVVSTAGVMETSRLEDVYDLEVEDAHEFFANGVLVHNSEKDLQQYLSAAFPVIIMDECGQFSGEAWQFMSSRNRVNRECKPDENGNFPVPVMMGCTNPIGPYWGFYKSQFVDKKPFDAPEDARRDKNGCWWVPKGDGWTLIYNPADWDYVHSTLLDNEHLMKRDPDLIRKLEALPKAMRDKLLSGHLDSTVGQYFDCWDESKHVVDLAKDPTAIIWQEWQARWIGWDYGRAHWNAMVWCTLALVRCSDGQYREKCVCYREYVDRGKLSKELVPNMMKLNAGGLPKGPLTATKIKTIFFSHEKFRVSAESKDKLSIAARINKLLKKVGMPQLTPNEASAGSRIRKATVLYDKLKAEEIVVLATCHQVIEAIPQLVRDESEREDVLKIDGKADDCFVAGTIIATEHGEKAIEDVRVGDQVWTRAGLKQVLRVTSKEREVWTLEGCVSISGTGDHKIWTTRGWRPLKSIAGASVFKLSNTTAVNGEDTLKQKSQPIVDTSADHGVRADKPSFIDRFGWMDRAKQFLKAITFTTKMAMSAIMTLRIWSAYLAKYTCVVIGANVFATLSYWIERVVIATIYVLRLQNGIAVLQGGHGTLQAHWGRSISGTTGFALSVANRFKQLSGLWFAASIAARHTDAGTVQELWRRFASDVALLFNPTRITSCDIVRVHAEPKLDGKRVVYDLTVADVHEFFANGLLVSNCYDALTMAMYNWDISKNKPFAVALDEVVQSAYKEYGPTVANMTMMQYRAKHQPKKKFGRQY